jgi:hypothetical protein
MQARENLQKLEHRSAKVAQWRKLVTKQDDDENFFEYTNASSREFGASGPSSGSAASATGEGASYGMEGGGTYDDEDIYDAVPTWFVGQMVRDECDVMVKAAGSGRFLVRESSSGDKYVISVNRFFHPNLLIFHRCLLGSSARSRCRPLGGASLRSDTVISGVGAVKMNEI